MKLKRKIIRITLIPALILTSMVLIQLWLNSNRFDVDEFNPDNIIEHITKLSSADFAGKKTGSPGNKDALEYVRTFFEEIGVESAGPENSYYQSFSTIVPEIVSSGEFFIADSNGNIIRDFVMYKDYRVLPSGRGGGLDFSGDLLLAGHNLFKVDSALIKNRIVLVESILPDKKKIDYVFENGGLGILFSSPTGPSADPRSI